MWREGWCLASCDRCGAKCVDLVPPGATSCDPALCESALYVGEPERREGKVVASSHPGPWCMLTCRRCSPVGLVELIP